MALHAMRRRILLALLRAPQGFNQLWGKQGESNAFAYHLAALVRQGYVRKEGARYALTDQGRKLGAILDADGNPAESPMPIVVLAVRKGDRYLCARRRKEPFLGYWSLLSGKLRFGESFERCAERTLQEKTGIRDARWTFRGIEDVRTTDGNAVLFHHVMFLLETRITRARLAPSRDVELAWLTLDEFAAKEGFPGGWFREWVGAQTPVLIEGERTLVDGRFTGARLVRVTPLARRTSSGARRGTRRRA